MSENSNNISTIMFISITMSLFLAISGGFTLSLSKEYSKFRNEMGPKIENCISQNNIKNLFNTPKKIREHNENKIKNPVLNEVERDHDSESNKSLFGCGISFIVASVILIIFIAVIFYRFKKYNKGVNLNKMTLVSILFVLLIFGFVNGGIMVHTTNEYKDYNHISIRSEERCITIDDLTNIAGKYTDNMTDQEKKALDTKAEEELRKLIHGRFESPEPKESNLNAGVHGLGITILFMTSCLFIYFIYLVSGMFSGNNTKPRFQPGQAGARSRAPTSTQDTAQIQINITTGSDGKPIVTTNN